MSARPRYSDDEDHITVAAIHPPLRRAAREPWLSPPITLVLIGLALLGIMAATWTLIGVRGI